MREFRPTSLPATLSAAYDVHNWRHAVQVLEMSYDAEWNDVVEAMQAGLDTARSLPVVNSQDVLRHIKRRGWSSLDITETTTWNGISLAGRVRRIGHLRGRVAFEAVLERRGIGAAETLQWAFDHSIIDVAVVLTSAALSSELLQQLEDGCHADALTALLGVSHQRVADIGSCPMLVLSPKQVFATVNDTFV